ncbi:MAG: DUF2946 domain-containing protein [Gammaproteobacteria bacterium]|nr:MAG: DUF2946 domain-containing protein [Gammaproteobacteria bacterium]
MPPTYNAHVIRSSSRFRHTAWLALAAALLIALAPAVSRILASHAGNASAYLVEMCTATGLKLVGLSSPIGQSDPTPPMPSMDEACGYCVLTAPLLLVVALLMVPHLRPAPAVGLHFYWLIPHSPRNRRGLGSQAPPLAT